MMMMMRTRDAMMIDRSDWFSLLRRRHENE